MKSKINIIIFILSATTIMLLILFGAVFLKFNEEHLVSNNATANRIDVIDCKSSGPDLPFFLFDGERNVEHEIKITYGKLGVDKYFYSYYGEYETEDSAIKAMSWMNGEFNIYLGRKHLDINNYPATFNTSNNIVKINIYLDRDNFANPAASSLTFLDETTLRELQTLNIQELKKKYEDRHFSCLINPTKGD